MAKLSKARRFEIFILIMSSLVLAMSALAVVYSKNLSRSIFMQIEEQEQLSDRYEVEWGQLQLEISTLAEQNQIESFAKDRLKLIVPEREKIIYIKP
mgnify:CR=1 FL=1